MNLITNTVFILLSVHALISVHPQFQQCLTPIYVYCDKYHIRSDIYCNIS